jgi:murein DD-endopeptidase MepM/ murein hydrolase activator NlpD
MSPGTIGAAGGLRPAAFVAVIAASLVLAFPGVAESSYPSPSASPSPSPSPSATASPRPSPSPTQAPSEPLPPADENYWNEMDDPDYEPPTPSPSPSAQKPPPTGQSGGTRQPRVEREDRVGPTPDEGGQERVEIETGTREREQQTDSAGRDSSLYSRDASGPGGFSGGYGLSTPSIDQPLTAGSDGAPLPARGSRSTEPIIRRLREAGAELDQVARTLAPFPVAGLATYAADWKPPADVEGMGADEGAAIMADEGVPVVASANGAIQRTAPDPGWGTSLELTGPDGTRYRYGRLLRVAPAIQDGMRVTRGQIIGFVGATGSLGGGSYLWFQLAGKDGAVISPYEHLDRWLKEALTTARVVTGLPGEDKADDVAAGLLTPEEAGMKIGPDGQPVSADQRLTGLDILLFLAIALPLAWRAVRGVRACRRADETPSVPERLELGGLQPAEHASSASS